MGVSMVEDWLEADGLILMESWARDGYTVQDIATRIGITQEALRGWMRKYPEIKQAINTGRELVDYKVENALLKAALGYKTTEVRVSTTIRNGRTIETVKERIEREQAPNVSACQVWLYNRVPKKWKNMNARANILDEIDEDTSIHITVERASARQDQSEDDKEWQDEINQSVSIRKATPEEQAQAEKAKQEAKSAQEKTLEDIGVEVSSKKPKTKKTTKKGASKGKDNVHTKSEPVDVDYWPDDWEDDE